MDCLEESNILISGATGYIGRWLLKSMQKAGKNVFALVRNSSAYADLDICEDRLCLYSGNARDVLDFCLNNRINTIIHLAAFQKTNHDVDTLDDYVEANITLGLHLLEALKENGQKKKEFICVGTNWQHYEQEQYRAVNLYAATKEAFGKIVDYYSDAFLMKAITLELYETYGPFDERNKIINLFLRQEAGDVLGMSPGEQKLDMLYIEDVILAFQVTLEHLQNMRPGNHFTYCLSTGEYLSIRDIVKLFEKVFEKKLNIQFGALSYKEREMMIPYQKGVRLPGWEKRYSLEEGLRDMRERILNKDE